ncbi:hypothetical protein NW762_013107 [Fusarium torreyae]|uniref:Cytochrome P450 n=1 Tax=Fusarium torreyae TaxID=1237075 RepID=A0A9W8RP01_9HYPO|nr:hypothetical protein NW762_013107 [Fusarium torreyae]
MDPSLIHDPVHHDLIATTLTKEIGNLIPGLVDEIDCCLNKHWGNNSKWKEVCIAETTQRILSGVNNRAFIGLPCCRNAPMLQSVIAFAQDLPLSLLILKAFPSILKPIVAPLITLPKRIHTNSFQSILAPEIKARLEEYDARNYGIQTTKSERNDFLQWSIEQAKDDGTSRNWQVGALAQRILLLNFVAIHTSTFAVTHALLDIASSSPDLVKELRLEVKTVLDYHGNQGSKRPLAQMGKLDSAIRESQRKNTFVAIGVGRVVIAEKGVTFPSGTHVRKGLSVAVPGYSVLQDPEVYPDSKTYQPLRFYKARHGIEDDNVKSAREALPTTSQNFLGWGSGRSACPGRFFASNEIKTMIAYISLRYDIEHLPERPRNTWIAQNRIPPMRATLRIRRKTSD